ncbi:MAG: hypothetical protein JSV26_02535 [bacterium]|nr:MAG: hypothetical protein JSV26_02535 [bacterium]
MDTIRKITLTALTVFLAAGFVCAPAAVHARSYKVSAFSSINRGDVAAAQAEALEEGLKKGVSMALEDMVTAESYQVFLPLFENRILTGTKRFISNYKIEYQDVSDLAYTVHLIVNVDIDQLKAELARIGIIKEPGSPPMAALFITVSLPVNKEQFSVIGEVTDGYFSRTLGNGGITVIPPPEGEFPFRVVRPPQEAETLISRALENRADLSLGILFQMNGEAHRSGKALTAPATVSYQILDVASQTLAGVGSRDVTLVLDTDSGEILEGNLNAVLGELAAAMASDLGALVSSDEEEREAFLITITGAVSSAVIRELSYRLIMDLGQDTVLLPIRFTPDEVTLKVFTERRREEMADRLAGLILSGHPVELTDRQGGFSLTVPEEVAVPVGVREYGEEIPFYRRIPAPGIDNPEDLIKVEVIPWQEVEENGIVALANPAPTGEAILGRIDPSRDRDLYRFQVPKNTSSITVSVEQAGPGEVRPRVRVFDGSGRLLGDRRAFSRGRGLYISLPVKPGLGEVVLSVEDYLGRYVSKFPYILSVGAVVGRSREG